jgi:outer membrane protein, multidrug efflux system
MRVHAAVLAVCAFAGCAITPQPREPMPVGDAPFHHIDADGGGALPVSNWLVEFDDPEMSRLVNAALANNYSIKESAARVAQARALVTASNAYQVPTVAVGASRSNSRVSGTVDDALPKRMIRTWAVPFDASYEVDLWGNLHATAEAAYDNALATQADAEGVRLRVATEVAADYLTLRFVRQDSEVLRQTIVLRQTALTLVQRRVKAGVSGDLDELRAETELSTTRADLADSERQEDNLIDALAVLIGEPVTEVMIDGQSGTVSLPAIPVGMPASLLSQRPDIYAAQRRLDSASLQIGIAKTAFLPTLTLSADGGFASRDLGEFLDRNSSVWGLAISTALTLVDGGRRRAEVDSAKAGYQIADAEAKSVVLDALREVQDSLNDIAAQRERIEEYQLAATTSSQAAQLSRQRYAHGYVDYFEVVDSDREELSIQRELIHSRQAESVATVALIRALGGGWEAAPTEEGQGAAGRASGLSSAGAVGAPLAPPPAASLEF